MKERLKKFFKHLSVEDLIVAGVPSAVLGLYVYHNARGHKIMAGGMLQNGQDDTFVIQKRNGDVSCFTKPPPTA